MLREAWRLARDRRYRNARWIERRAPANLFQPFTTTSGDRYPEIFRFAREMLGDGPQMRLLSFGCATGEEVFSLRRYFPQARIVGIDINPRNIAAAGRARSDETVAIKVASSTDGQPGASYDAIFCLAVLRHGRLNHAQRADPLLHFVDFERTVSDFARCLKPGGLLVLRHANFRFRDTGVAQDFETVLRLPPNPKTPLFGRDNRRLVGITDDEVAFRKPHS